MPGDETKEISAASIANLTDHMLDLNQQGNGILNNTLDCMGYVTMPHQPFLLALVPILDRIIQLSSEDPKSRRVLKKAVIRLKTEAMEIPKLFHGKLAHRLYIKVACAISNVLSESSGFKQKAFYSVMLSSLSQVNLLNDKLIIPKRLVEKMKALTHGAEEDD